MTNADSIASRPSKREKETHSVEVAGPGSHRLDRRVAEFFAGIGLVRIGLEQAGLSVSWSNDIEPAKEQMYRHHFANESDHTFALKDVGSVSASEFPQRLAMAWASFPCTDLSLAGGRTGLNGTSSSTFWHFTRILSDLGTERPQVIAVENVTGFATSGGGADMTGAISELNALGYSIDVIAVDARRFVPQSRPRLFLVGALDTTQIVMSNQPHDLRPSWLDTIFNDPNLITHRAALPEAPPEMKSGFSALAQKLPSSDDRWWTAERHDAFVDSLSPLQSARIGLLQAARKISYRTAYRRMRNGKAMWEVRADDIAGCLRTPRGGSSKQAVVKLGFGKIRVRWMTGKEYARLMGAGAYRIDGLRDSQIQFGFGDAVCVPVVRWIADNYLVPLIDGQPLARSVATESTDTSSSDRFEIRAALDDENGAAVLAS